MSVRDAAAGPREVARLGTEQPEHHGADGSGWKRGDPVRLRGRRVRPAAARSIEGRPDEVRVRDPLRLQPGGPQGRDERPAVVGAPVDALATSRPGAVRADEQGGAGPQHAP